MATDINDVLLNQSNASQSDFPLSEATSIIPDEDRHGGEVNNVGENPLSTK